MKKKFIYSLVTLFLICSAFGQNNIISINHKTNKDNTIDFFYKKNAPGSYSINIEFTSLTNCFSNSFKSVVKGYSGRLFTLKPINPTQGIGLAYKYTYVLGNLNPKIDSLYTYSIPFKKGTDFTCFEQDFVGEKYFENEAPKNWKSYQFSTSDNDTVYATRKGIIIKVEDKFKSDSLNYYYTSKKNEVLIEHEDGTIGSYIGFKHKEILVKLGDVVYPQTPIGIATSLYNNIKKIEFRVFFLINPNFYSNRNETLKNKIHKHQFIFPYFLTTEGKTQLIPHKKYTSYFNKELLINEMSKKEIKKLKL